MRATLEAVMRPFACLFVAAAALTVGGCAVPVGITVASYAADGALMVATDKTGTDHLLSIAAGEDCAMWRVVKDRDICTARKPGEENPYDVDLDAPHREADEGGMVSVYSASRDGGRLLSDSEAKLAMTPRPVPQAPAEAQSPPAAADDGSVPPVLQADVRWTDDAKPSTAAAKPVPRSGGKKAATRMRRTAPVAKGAAARRAVTAHQPAKRPAAGRSTAGRGSSAHAPLAVASATP
jgi:hypothetical protein